MNLSLFEKDQGCKCPILAKQAVDIEPFLQLMPPSTKFLLPKGYRHLEQWTKATLWEDWSTQVQVLLGKFSSAQSLSHVWLFATPWTAAHQASLSITNSQSPPKPMPIALVTPSTISSSVVPFSSCPQSFPASGSFQMSQLFTSDGQSTGVSASTSVLPMNTQD